MKRILILGAGTAGTIMANKLRKALSVHDWEIMIIDREKKHYYQPGFLFIPFGQYTEKDVVKPKAKFIPKGVRIDFLEIEKILADKNEVLLGDGTILSYDYLVVATGSQIKPNETPGLNDTLHYKNIFDFYTIEGALALKKCFDTWEGGKLVMAITELPFKCPVAPIEFVCLAEAFFSKRGMHPKVEITFVTPLSGAFTKPIASEFLTKVLEEKEINIITDFYLERVDNDRKVMISYDREKFHSMCLLLYH